MLRGLALGGLLVVYLAFAAAFAHLTPAWNNPDEPAHYLYIAHIAETGTLPVLEPGDWDPGRLEPLIRSHFPPGTSIDFLRYEAWQPPLYYLVSAPVYRLAPPEARLPALHVFNILLGAASLTLTYLVARAFFACVSVLGARESRWFPLLVAGALLGVPMFAATSAAINNDNLANVLGGALTLMLLSAPFSAPSYRWAGLFGVLLGLATAQATSSTRPCQTTPRVKISERPQCTLSSTRWVSPAVGRPGGSGATSASAASAPAGPAPRPGPAGTVRRRRAPGTSET